MTENQAERLWRLIENYVESACEEVDCYDHDIERERKMAFNELSAYINELTEA